MKIAGLHCVLLLVGVSANLAGAQSTRYFRDVEAGSPEMYQFRYEVNGSDTSTAKVYRATYDSAGRVIAWQYLSAGRQVKDPVWNIAGATVAYSPSEEYHRFFDEHQRPTRLARSRSFAERRTWLNNNAASRLDQLEIDGSPVKADRHGCSSYFYVLDAGGRIKKEFCLDELGERVSRRSGIYEVRYDYEDSTRTYRMELLDAAGNLVDTASPIFSVTLDHMGNQVELRQYDRDGKLNRFTLPIERMRYDEYGYLHQLEELTAASTLIYRTEYRYDSRGNLLEIVEYPTSVSSRKSRVARTLAEFDDRNLLIKEIFYGYDSRFLRQIKHSYTAAGYLSESLYLDSLGMPFKAANFTRVQYLRDRYGNSIRTTYLDYAGKPAATEAGYAHISRSYDSTGQIIEIQYRDALDRAVNPNGKPPAIRVFTYSEKGRLLQTSDFDAEGTPVSVTDWTPGVE